LAIKLAMIFWMKQLLQGKACWQYRDIGKGFNAAKGVSGRKARQRIAAQDLCCFFAPWLRQKSCRYQHS
jgi:hypothetical protein